MMFSKISRMVTLFVIMMILFVQPAWSMVYNIKGTYEVVKPDYKHLSLLHGAILWETGFVRRLDDFGEIQKKLGKDKAGRTVIESYEPGGHDTVKLLYALFYRVPGSSSVTDFGETKQIEATDEQILDNVATVLVQCSEVRKQLPVLREALKALENKAVGTKVEKSVQELRGIIATTDAQKKIKTLKGQAPTIKNDIDNVSKALLLFAKPLADSQKNLKAFLKKPAYLNINLQQALAGSLIESDINDDKAIYLPYMTEMIILTFVYKKFGLDKTKFQYFYNKLNEKLGKNFLTTELSPEIEKSIKAIAARIALEKLFKEKSQDYEQIVFLSTQINGYPSPNGYANADYILNGKKIDSMPDCMDNAFRNFIRLLAYDPEKQDFKGGVLHEKAFPLGEDLKEFLKKYDNRRADASLDAHSAWLNVISNIKHVLYNRTKDGVSYELQPCIRNIIVLLDYFLGLDLFKGKKLEKEVSRTDFIKEYFQPLCKKLGCEEGFLATSAQAQRQDENIKFDQLDLTSQVFTTFEFKKFGCQFMTKFKAHGELSLHGSEKDLEIANSSFDTMPSLSLIVTDLKTRSRINDLSYLKGKSIYSNLFSLALENTNNTNKLLAMVPNVTAYGNCEENVLGFDLRGASVKNIFDLLLRINDKQPDENVKIKNKLRLLTILVVKGNKDTYKIALETAQTEINHDKRGALKLYMVLVSQGYNDALGVATEVASKIGFDDDRYSIEVQILFEALINQQQAFNEALKVAQNGINSGNEYTIKCSIGLFIALAKKGQISEDTLLAAKKGVELNIWELSLSLYEALLQQGKIVNETIPAAQEALKYKNLGAEVAAMSLFEALVKKGLALNEASESINIFKHSDRYVEAYSKAVDYLLNLIKEKSTEEPLEQVSSSELITLTTLLQQLKATLSQLLNEVHALTVK